MQFHFLSRSIPWLHRDPWISGSSPPPSSFCKLVKARQWRQNSFSIQRGFARPTEPQRLAQCQILVSEPLSSLSDRTSMDSVRYMKAQRFRSFAVSCRSNFSPHFCRQAFNQRHSKWAWCRASMRAPAYAPSLNAAWVRWCRSVQASDDAPACSPEQPG